MSSMKSIAVVFCLGMLFLPGNLHAETAPTSVPELAAESAVKVPRSPEAVFLPSGDLFQPLLADPKEPRFYISYLMVKFGSENNKSAVGGYGETFGLYRSGGTAGYSWQANFSGSIHAQFDLDSSTVDLVNTDYTFGFPFSIRKGAASYRIAVYHQSSHLGDEFLLKNNIERVEFSYEAFQLIGSYEWTSWRVYYGGEYIFHQGPTDLKPLALQMGVEYYAPTGSPGRGRLVGGLDVKSDQTHDWALNSSVKAGLQFDSTESNGRYVRLLAVGYTGFVPYGQFYNNRVSSAGVEVSLKF